MDTLFEKLDQLSSPLGSLLDVVLNRLAPHTTASAACGGGPGTVYCGYVCGARCQNGALLETKYWAHTVTDCVNRNYSAICGKGCIC
jgi:hypothetical protein